MANERKVKLTIDQGSTFRKKLIWKAGTPAVPVDLTGYTARMQIREKLDATAVLKELTTANGGITLGTTNGEINLYISAVDTTAFTWSAGVYDLEMIAPGGDVKRLIEGSVVVLKEVTR
jgi:hypothetical protein